MLQPRKSMLLFLLFGFTWLRHGECVTDIIKIGAIFGPDEDATLLENAFKFALTNINNDKTILPHSRLVAHIERLKSLDSFQATRQACALAERGVATILGPPSNELGPHIDSMCYALQLPHLDARLETTSQSSSRFSVNLYPDFSLVNKAFLDLVNYQKFDKLLVIFGASSGLFKLHGIIEQVSPSFELIIREVSLLNMRSVLKESQQRRWNNILVDLSIEETEALLKIALQEGMIDLHHNFILANLDAATLDLEDYKHNFANITVFSLPKTDSPIGKQILNRMKEYEEAVGVSLRTDNDRIKLNVALVHDAVYSFAYAIQGMNNSSPIGMIDLKCDLKEGGVQAWDKGESLYNYMNMVHNKMEGLTGKIRFTRGHRTQFEFEVLQLTEHDNMKAIGTWNSSVEGKTGINITSPLDFDPEVGVFGNKTLIVTSVLEQPYVMRKVPEKGQPQKNDEFEGFCIDLLDMLAEHVGFKYSIYLAPDGNYGALTDSGEWDGVIKELIDRKADMAIGQLTINYQREQVVDFTKPFMSLGISILFKVPKKETPGLFSFLNPLALDIWLYVIAAYVVVSLTLFTLARFSPYEWYNPHPCNEDTDTVANLFNLSNSFWFSVGTLMQQGSDINPRAISTRLVGGIWWFFTLIIISSYTANLAAFLTVERMVNPIENAEQMVKQTKIKYGTRDSSNTKSFFKESKIETYKKMWSFMDAQSPSVFVKTYDEGVDRVKAGDYAFLMESTTLDYRVQRDCDLMQVGGLLSSNGYGIATPIGSPYRDSLSMSILDLQERGKIQELYLKWWKNTGQTCNREDDKNSKAEELSMDNVGGIFVVLLGGLALSVLVAIVEFIWNSKRNAKADKQSLCSEMTEELRFAMKCVGSNKKKSRKKRPSCSGCKKLGEQHNHNGDISQTEVINGLIPLAERRSPHQELDGRTSRVYIDRRGDEYQLGEYTA